MNQTEDRSKFIYKTRYGTTTDIYALPVGTTFTVSNGAWNGCIIEENGKRYLQVKATKRKFEITDDKDFGLVLYDIKYPE